MSAPPKYNTKSPTIRRILREAQEIASSPSPDFTAHPLDHDLFEWHFTLRGPPEPSPYAGGFYHGRILLASTYPHRPPMFRFLTPSARFEVNRDICLSMSGHHEETWQPAWGIRTALVALRAFMDTNADGQVGGMESGEKERKALAKESITWKCSECGGGGEEEALKLAMDEAGSSGRKEEAIPAELKLGYKDELKKKEVASQPEGEANTIIPAVSATQAVESNPTSVQPAALPAAVTRDASIQPPNDSIASAERDPQAGQQPIPSQPSSSIPTINQATSVQDAHAQYSLELRYRLLLEAQRDALRRSLAPTEERIQNYLSRNPYRLTQRPTFPLNPPNFAQIQPGQLPPEMQYPIPQSQRLVQPPINHSNYNPALYNAIQQNPMAHYPYSMPMPPPNPSIGYPTLSAPLQAQPGQPATSVHNASLAELEAMVQRQRAARAQTANGVDAAQTAPMPVAVRHQQAAIHTFLHPNQDTGTAYIDIAIGVLLGLLSILVLRKV